MFYFVYLAAYYYFFCMNFKLKLFRKYERFLVTSFTKYEIPACHFLTRKMQSKSHEMWCIKIICNINITYDIYNQYVSNNEKLS